MTIDERVSATIENLSCTSGERTTAHAIIAAAIREARDEAVAEEREACAQIARDYDQRWNAATCDAIAAAIMSRDVFTEQT